jgi:hypothetical protein
MYENYLHAVKYDSHRKELSDLKPGSHSLEDMLAPIKKKNTLVC